MNQKMTMDAQPLPSATGEAKSRCVSCHAILQGGKYCSQCGETVLDADDRALSVLLKESLALYFFLDGKVFRSFAALFIHPGKLTWEYHIGRLKPYLTPIQVFFIANILYFLFSHSDTFSSSFYAQRYLMPYSTAIVQPMIDKHCDGAINEGEVERRYNAVTYQLSRSLMVLNVPLFAMFIAGLFRIHKWFFAEAVVYSLHVYGFILFGIQVLFSLPYTLLFEMMNVRVFLTDEVRSTVYGMIIWGYNAISFRKIFHCSVLSAIGYGAIAVVSILFTLFLYRLLLFFISFAAVIDR